MEKQALELDEVIEKAFSIFGFKVKDSELSEVMDRRMLDPGDLMERLVLYDNDCKWDDNEIFTFKGNPISMQDYCILKYTPEQVDIIKQAFMIDQPDQEDIISRAAKKMTENLFGKQAIQCGDLDKWTILIGELNGILGLKSPLDIMGSMIKNQPVIDVKQLDEMFGERDSEYDFKKCLYRGNRVSMQDYVINKFGKRASDLIEFFIGKKEFEQVWQK